MLKPRASLATRLAHLSRPTRNAVSKVKEQEPEIVGRPLWSANFAGENAPSRVVLPCLKSSPTPTTSLPSTTDTAGTQQKNQPCHEMAASTSRKETRFLHSSSGGTASSSSAVIAGTSSPIVQYVSYNYKPIVLQSPTSCSTLLTGKTGVGGMMFPTVDVDVGALRSRTTSTIGGSAHASFV